MPEELATYCEAWPAKHSQALTKEPWVETTESDTIVQQYWSWRADDWPVNTSDLHFRSHCHAGPRMRKAHGKQYPCRRTHQLFNRKAIESYVRSFGESSGSVGTASGPQGAATVNASARINGRTSTDDTYLGICGDAKEMCSGSGEDEKEVWRWRRAAQSLSAENVDVASGPQGAATACGLTCTSAPKSTDNISSGCAEEEEETWRWRRTEKPLGAGSVDMASGPEGAATVNASARISWPMGTDDICLGS